MSRRSRPWRAVASYRLAPGLPPVVVGRCYRATRAGLDRFIRDAEAAGAHVEVWEVIPHPQITAAAEASAQAASVR